MGADDEIFQKDIVSSCPSINGRPVAEALMSFSQLGFPGVSILGPAKVALQIDDYPHQYLSKPFDRETKPTGCVLVWKLHSGARVPDPLFVTLGIENLELTRVCV
jgi:hypothetical protein